VDELASQTTKLMSGEEPGQTPGHRQAHRIQLRAANRQVHGQRLHQGRMKMVWETGRSSATRTCR
jgi:hypothetical protein